MRKSEFYEPWDMRGGSCPRLLLDSDGRHIASFDEGCGMYCWHAVVCVNACAGLTTTELETLSAGGVARLLDTCGMAELVEKNEWLERKYFNVIAVLASLLENPCGANLAAAEAYVAREYSKDILEVRDNNQIAKLKDRLAASERVGAAILKHSAAPMTDFRKAVDEELAGHEI